MSEEDVMIHRELFEKVNLNTIAVEVLSAKVEILTTQNDKFLKVIKWAMALMFTTICILLFALVYGALGSEGMKAVRGAIPVISADMSGADDLAVWLSKAKG